MAQLNRGGNGGGLMEGFGQFFMDNFEAKINPIFNTISLLYLLSSQTGLIILSFNNPYMIA